MPLYTEAALFGHYWIYQGYKDFIVETWDGTTDHRSQCLFAFSKPIIVFYSLLMPFLSRAYREEL